VSHKVPRDLLLGYRDHESYAKFAIAAASIAAAAAATAAQQSQQGDSSISSNRRLSTKPAITIQDCLGAFTSTEELDENSWYERETDSHIVRERDADDVLVDTRLIDYGA
jgi:hypothetical protein